MYPLNRVVKKFLIAGFTERTGFATAKFLLKRGFEVLASDIKKDKNKVSLAEKLQVEYPRKFEFVFGKQDESLLENVDKVVLSPGVPRSVDIVRKALNRGIEVIGDVELFYRYYPDAVYVGITGTDGKSTTSSLIYHILKSSGRRVHLAGNIGVPVCSLDGKVEKDDVVVLELSSFQIESIFEFRPNVGVLLNLAEDHLDRYESVFEYWNAKLRLFKNQKDGDWAVLKNEDKIISLVETKARVLTFGLNDDSTAYFNGDDLFLNGEKLMTADSVPLVGLHNLENVLASALVCSVLGVDVSHIREAVKTFKGLPHRMEFAGEIEGVKFINDSKATTINAVSKALVSLNFPVVLIMGGKDKSLDFSQLNSLLEDRVSHLILIGEAKKKIKKQISYRGPVFELDDLKSAIWLAFEKAKQVSGIVLFSPGCASFDMFRDYEERGNVFKETVESLRKEMSQ